MKVHSDKTSYHPVTLTLETEEEFLNLFALFNHIDFRNKCLPAFPEKSWKLLDEAYEAKGYDKYHNLIQKHFKL